MIHWKSEEAWSDFRVGLITFAGLFFLVLGVTFAGGEKGLLFHKTGIVAARLADISGLKKGGSVTMGGMTIGKVTKTGFVEGSASKEIEITMEVRSDVRGRIKTDSAPSVRTQGMLGDRYVDISMGTDAADVLPEGQALTGTPAADFDRTLQHTAAVLEETKKMLAAINRQEGTAGQFVYDEKLYEGLTKITEQLNSLIEDFKKHPRKYIKFSLF